MNTRLKAQGIITALLSTAYIAWLFFNVHGTFGYILFFCELLLASLWGLFLLNHWSQSYAHHAPETPSGSLDVFLPIAGESPKLFEKTLRAACEIDYLRKKIIVLDDGNSPDIKRLANKYKAHYFTRDTRTDNKAGNLNNGFIHSNSEFILVLDADQIVSPYIACDLLGFFKNNPTLAVITTRQKFNVEEHDFNHDILFYNHMQAGKNADNASISCGSGVFYRRSALKKIGGFQTWNIVEDLYTTYVLHQHGFKSLYINRPYTMGTAPTDIATIYKQRGTWATDTLRLFFKKSPLLTPGLTIAQRLHYFEIGWAYIISAIVVPILFLLPIVSLLFNVMPISNIKIYLLLRVPSLIAIIYFYFRLSGNTFSTSCYWAALFPVYLKALFLSLLPQKPIYHVTKKTTEHRADLIRVLPHILLITLSLGVTLWRITIDRSISQAVLFNIVWIGLMIFWFFPILKKGLGLERHVQRLVILAWS